MPEYPGVYIKLPEPSKLKKPSWKERRDLRNSRKAFKASAKKYIAEVRGVPADSLSVHIKSNGVDTFSIKTKSADGSLTEFNRAPKLIDENEALVRYAIMLLDVTEFEARKMVEQDKELTLQKCVEALNNPPPRLFNEEEW